LASQTNAVPLPAVPEVFGVRLPPPSESLTSVDFDLVPNKPPPGVKLYDEEIEEIEESEESEDEDEDEDMEPAPIPPSLSRGGRDIEMRDASFHQPPVGPVSAIQDVSGVGGDEGSEEEDGLFAGGEEDDEDEDDESGADENMEEVQVGAPSTNGVKRKLVEEEDYD
jgi:transcription initiation factor TFIID subunit 9B